MRELLTSARKKPEGVSNNLWTERLSVMIVTVVSFVQDTGLLVSNFCLGKTKGDHSPHVPIISLPRGD